MKFKGFGHTIQPWRAHCLATGLAPFGRKIVRPKDSSAELFFGRTMFRPNYLSAENLLPERKYPADQISTRKSRARLLLRSI
jgi:hypothetical protein